MRRRLRRARRLRIEALYVYPIKGCRGHALPCVELTRWGLKDDRHYVVVNAKDVFVSQRELPRMALIHPDLPTAAGLRLRAVARDGADNSKCALPAPLLVPRRTEADGAPRLVRIWDDDVPGVDQGDVAARWLQSFLGKEGLRLMLVADSARRATSLEYGVGETAFADGFPILLTSQASIDDVNRRLRGVAVSLDNFRPNVHVSGCGPFEEDEVPAVAFHRSGGRLDGAAAVRLRLVKPCSRCTVPNVRPRTGEREASEEPLRTLRVYRSGERLRRTAGLHRAFFAHPKHKREAYFGQNVLLEFTPGAMLAVGDEGEVEW